MPPFESHTEPEKQKVIIPESTKDESFDYFKFDSKDLFIKSIDIDLNDEDSTDVKSIDYSRGTGRFDESFFDKRDFSIESEKRILKADAKIQTFLDEMEDPSVSHLDRIFEASKHEIDPELVKITTESLPLVAIKTLGHVAEFAHKNKLTVIINTIEENLDILTERLQKENTSKGMMSLAESALNAEIIKTLGSIKSDKAFPALKGFLKKDLLDQHPDIHSRSNCFRALGKIGGEETLELLVKFGEKIPKKPENYGILGNAAENIKIILENNTGGDDHELLDRANTALLKIKDQVVWSDD